MIACVLIPAFLAAVERQLTPALIGVPVIIRTGTRSYVYAVDAEAARAGVLPGMPIRQAVTLCPHAALIPANPPRYRDALDALGDSLMFFAEKVEVAGLPRFGKSWRRRSGLAVQAAHYHAVAYLDLGVLKPTEAIDLGRQIQQYVQAYQRMPATIGLAANKFTAYAAARLAKTGDVQLVRPGSEAGFLARRSVNLLPLEPEIARRLRLFGLDTIGAFAALPAGAVLAQFGKSGRQLHQLAHGLDDRPVLTRPPRREERLRQPFDDPVTHEPTLTAVLSELAACLAHRLNGAALQARCLRLALQTDDGAGHEVERRLRRPQSDAAHMTRTLLRLFESLVLRRGITEMTVSAVDLVQVEHQQLELFSQDYDERESARALEDLVARFGSACFYRALVIDTTARLPDERFELEAVEAA